MVKTFSDKDPPLLPSMKQSGDGNFGKFSTSLLIYVTTSNSIAKRHGIKITVIIVGLLLTGFRNGYFSIMYLILLTATTKKVDRNIAKVYKKPVI